MTVAQLCRVMSEREFRSWARYVSQKPLPTRRIEYALGVVALTQARLAGNDASLEDFVMAYIKRAKSVDKQDAAKAAQMLDSFAGGVGVRRLGQGRKKR